MAGYLAKHHNVVSIHAPVRGSDTPKDDSHALERMFQSTLPCEGATRWKDYCLPTGRFQSTLPCEGATLSPRTCFKYM